MSVDKKRLIEVDFPLEQVSLDSVHEKNVRHGHISTLHIWPARRPLAACRAALIATLLPDPGNAEERRAIYRRLAGEVVEKIEKKKINGRTVEVKKKETKGGILHWGRESGPDLDWFREKIREAYGGRAPKVLDPFAGGGAIPFEAMRLGCETTAIDINPVAWFILKCTLEYPQKLAGKTLPLPEFVLRDHEFLQAYLKAKGFKGKALERQLAQLNVDQKNNAATGVAEPELIYEAAPSAGDTPLEADLAWQVRAWGRWVLAEARERLAHRYSTYAEFEPLKPGGPSFEPQPLQLLELDRYGNTAVFSLNTGFTESYLKDPRNPRWIEKPTVAYLWARTVRCKVCRATIPLLKTKWLAKRDSKRVLLKVIPNADRTGVAFDIEQHAPVVGGNAAQRREHDRKIGTGTMSRSGAQCGCCPAIMSMEDIRLEGREHRLGAVMTAVVVDGLETKEYRVPTALELTIANISRRDLDALFSGIPFGLPTEPLPGKEALGFRVPLYGFDQWGKLFTDRQQLCLGTFVSLARDLNNLLSNLPPDWREAIVAYISIANDRLASMSTTLCRWENKNEFLVQTFARFALPILWDFGEVNPLSTFTGSYDSNLDWVVRFIDHALIAENKSMLAVVERSSATTLSGTYDLILTDPPYYDAIPYSDLMDFFYIWLRRSLWNSSPEVNSVFSTPLGPKWDASQNDGELIDDASRFGGDRERSKRNYEEGMARVFAACATALNGRGHLCVVFANKQPDAWETLVGALIRSGFLVDGSWPIQTERLARARAHGSAALASSIWLVCKKRPPRQAGWDTAVLAEMRERIHDQLRAFWDAGIRGPDFVWAATGPALEAYSKYPAVRKANESGALMSVSEFLKEVRRIVVDFVVGRVFQKDGMDEAAAGSLDDVTTYYLLHRHDFRLEDAPVGACILYALSCNLSDSDLADRYDILLRSGGNLLDTLDETDEEASDDEADDADDSGATGGKGNKVRLKDWKQRKGKSLGYEAPGGRPVPLIDQAHRLMHLWREGDEAKVDEYLDTRGLKRNELFRKVLQALIELSAEASEERSILEALSNHIGSREGVTAPRQARLALGTES